MSVSTMPTSGGLSRGRGNSENKGRMAGKGRHRSTLGQQFENPTLSHPGKSAVGGGPVATPRKPLALLDHNTKPTPANKGHGPGNQKKKGVRVVGSEKSKRSGLRAVRPVADRPSVAPPRHAPATTQNEESEDFPEIETMSRRQEEPDELDIGRFVPPAYFKGVAAAVRQPLVLPPVWGSSHRSSILSSLSTDQPDILLRPDSPVGCDLLYSREELDLPEQLPDINLPDIDFW